MKKQDIEQLYHLLRVVSNASGERKVDQMTGLSPHEQVDVIYGLCRHLLAGGDYSALVRFSQFYGESFLVEPTFNAIKNYGWQPERVVEFGAGLGWLARGLSARLGMTPCLFVDKRPWPLIDLVADLETEEGREEVLAELKEGDLIVACELVHCLDYPKEVMSDFASWPTAIIEYYPDDASWRESYSAQTARYGASHIMSARALGNVFSGRTTTTINIAPFILMLVDPAVKDE